MKFPPSLLALSFALILPAPAGRAAPPSPPDGHPLGRNVTYARVHALPADLPSSTAVHQGSLVLDLRFVPAGAEEAQAFAAWLKFQARPAAPVIVLINAQTSPALFAPLADAEAPPGVVSIGPAAAGIKPDLALDVTAEADRRAYEAFEHGTPLTELVTPKLDKTRHDEAEIARERTAAANGDVPDGDAGDDDLPAGPPKTITAVLVSPPAPVDAVLQRALQLHRALLALRKIP